MTHSQFDAIALLVGYFATGVTLLCLVIGLGLVCGMLVEHGAKTIWRVATGFYRAERERDETRTVYKYKGDLTDENGKPTHRVYKPSTITVNGEER